MPRYAYPICKHTCRVDYLLKEDTKMRTCVFRQDTTPSTHGKYEAAKYALPLLPRVFAPARCSIEHQPVYKIPIIKILVGVFARARAMEKYEERSPRTFYQALEDGTCRGFYIRFLCSDCEKLNRIRTLFFYRNWYLIYFRVLMTKLYTSCPIENFEKLRKGEASNRPLCLRMLKEKEREGGKKAQTSSEFCYLTYNYLLMFLRYIHLRNQSRTPVNVDNATHTFVANLYYGGSLTSKSS